MSLRQRLLTAMALVAAVLAAVAVVITVTTRAHLVDQLDERLATYTTGGPRRLPPSPPVAGGGPGGENEAGDAGGEDGQAQRPSDVYQGLVVDGEQIDLGFATDGYTARRQPDLSAVALDALPDGRRRRFTVDAADGSTSYRVLAVGTEQGAQVWAVPLDDVRETIRRLVVVQVAGTAGIVALLGLVTWWVLRLGIRPVKQMTAVAAEIAGGNLDVRVPESDPATESGELAAALNAMLGRIQGALDERESSELRLRRFVADASHELRTPLTTIRGYAELYRHGGLGDDAAMTDAMRRTEQEAGRMGRLVEDMLTLAKLDDERPLRLAPVDLARLVADVVADLALAHPHREVELSTDAITVVADEDRLRQAVINVVNNALVHTDVPATVAVRVTAETTTDPGRHAASDGASVGAAVGVVTVVDTGDGVPAEVTAKMTERFYRADPSRSRHRGGSGLGLAIVEQVAAAHGGSVTIKSAVGRGTTVRLTVPVTGPVHRPD